MTAQQAQWNLIGTLLNKKQTVLAYAGDTVILNQSKDDRDFKKNWNSSQKIWSHSKWWENNAISMKKKKELQKLKC